VDVYWRWDCTPPLENNRTHIWEPHMVIPTKYRWFSWEDRVKKALSTTWMRASNSRDVWEWYFTSQTLAKVFQFNSIQLLPWPVLMAKSGFLHFPMNFLSWACHPLMIEGAALCSTWAANDSGETKSAYFIEKLGDFGLSFWQRGVGVKVWDKFKHPSSIFFWVPICLD